MAGMTIIGLEQLRAELRAFPAALQTRAINTGLRKASAQLRTAFRRGAYSAPMAKGYKRTGKLRLALRSAVGKRASKKGKAWVGLKKIAGESGARNYYRTLEFGRKGGPPLRPFFAKVWNAQRATVGAIIVAETRKAIAYEAGKALGRSRARSSGRKV
jgi:hypothetical protein